MVDYSRETDRREQLKEAVEATRESENIAESLYKDGLKDFIYVLDAQRALFSAEDNLAASNAEIVIVANLIRLYKALGGGWVPVNLEIGKKQ